MHTQGPWRASYNSKLGQHSVLRSDRVEYGETTKIAIILTGLNPFEDAGNARLMAAAPELLDALEVAKTALAGAYDDCGAGDLSCYTEGVQINEAIRKATGR